MTKLELLLEATIILVTISWGVLCLWETIHNGHILAITRVLTALFGVERLLTITNS